jgi:hypothetical protein
VNTRLRAIGCALFYGLAPFWLYEDEPHYWPMGYLPHLGMNLALAARWLTFREDEGDRQFEREVNGKAPTSPIFASRANPQLLRTRRRKQRTAI